MRFQNRKSHMIDLLFPIAIFFVFTLSALTVVLLAANIYQHTTDSASRNYTSRTVLSYVNEKIRQSDTTGGVALGVFDREDALILSQEIEGVTYKTYIYEYNHSLRELFIKDGVDAVASDGKPLMDVEHFTMEQVGDSLYQFSCTDTDGTQMTIVAGVQS